MTGKGRKTWVWLVLAAAGAALVWWLWRRRKARAAAPAVTTAEPAPTALSPSPALVPPPASTSPGEPPAGSVDDEAEALARVIASEAGRQSPEIQTRVAWTVRNRARYKDTTIARMVCQPCGKQVGNRRPFSSAQAPTAKHRALAAQVLAMPLTEDPTRGADHILEPALMDRQFAAGKSKFDARAVRARRLKGGLDYYGSFGSWDFFGPKGGPGAQPLPADWKLGERVA
jgi:hypothetical protein